jgi:spore germination cell wall hydrolase CwlJ-like protein
MTDPYAAFSAPVGGAAPAPQRAAPQRRAPRPARPQVQFSDDRDALTRTVIGEAGNQDDVGQVAVASVALNRARNRNMTPSQIVLEPHQFEPWGTGESASRLMAIQPNDPRYIAASAAVDRALAGEDPTGGADHFFAPAAQSALGRPEHPCRKRAGLILMRTVLRPLAMRLLNRTPATSCPLAWWIGIC